MPCAAPCNRLPCDERCQRLLKCGHRCPGLCGETCLEGHCQDCGQKADSRVDLLEFRAYGDIDLDETPVVALACGHFFTAESLDGLVGLAAVYTSDRTGRHDGIREPSAVLALPSCPDCKQPIRQFATQRYNRVVNMAVMDETSRKFQMKGAAKLKRLEELTDALEASLEQSCGDLVRRRPASLTTGFSSLGALTSYDSRYGRCTELRKDTQGVCKAASHEQQPAKKLADAIAHARKPRQGKSKGRAPSPLDEDMAQLNLEDGEVEIPTLVLNQQITLGARMAQLRIDDVMLCDQLRLVGADLAGGIVWPQGHEPRTTARRLLGASECFIDECQAARLPRLAVQASIAFARVVGYLGSHAHRGPSATDNGKGKAVAKTADEERVLGDNVKAARRRLDDAARMCESSGFEGAPELLGVVKSLQRRFEKERYEPVTADELAAIKAAMVSGRGGIATHSGHWYKCRNGHIVSFPLPPLERPLECPPVTYCSIKLQMADATYMEFAIGECGMPMELARCPECRAPIGGQHHQLVEGASRATEMEQ